MSETGPPKFDEGRDSPPDITSTNLSGRSYPETPMPTQYEEEDDYEGNYDEESKHSEKSNFFENALKILFVAIAVTHLFTVWTLRADINIIMQYQNELAQQNKHITDLLHNQHQVKWQIVPSQNALP